MTSEARYAALAVAHRAANAVGPVAFVLGEAGLRLEFAGVRPHLRGFALGGEAQHVTLEVPYTAVRGLVREGRVLLVSFDPRVLYPYNRFALLQFRREPAEALPKRARTARIVSWAARLLTLAGTIATALSPPLVGRGWAVRGGATLVAGGVFLLLLRAFSRRILWGGAASDRLRDELQGALSERLGLGARPAKVIELAESTDGLEDALASVSRPRWLAPALVLAVAGLLVAGQALRRFGVTQVVRLPVPDARTGLAAVVLSLVNVSKAALSPRHPACTCERADSVLWVDPPRRVGLLITPLIGEFPVRNLMPEVAYSLMPGPRERIEFDLSFVNGASVRIPGVTLVLTFWHREGNERRHISERGLSWPHGVDPGGSVKWHVRAQGDALRITSYLPANMEAAPYATPDAFAELSRANVSAVRLHGATMLAYLRDPRAAAAVRALEGLSPLEELARASLASTLEPWMACGARDDRLCVFNGTKDLSRGVELHDPSGHSVSVKDLFFPARGLSVRFAGAKGPITITPDR